MVGESKWALGKVLARKPKWALLSWTYHYYVLLRGKEKLNGIPQWKIKSVEEYEKMVRSEKE